MSYVGCTIRHGVSPQHCSHPIQQLQISWLMCSFGRVVKNTLVNWCRMNWYRFLKHYTESASSLASLPSLCTITNFSSMCSFSLILLTPEVYWGSHQSLMVNYTNTIFISPAVQYASYTTTKHKRGSCCMFIIYKLVHSGNQVLYCYFWIAYNVQASLYVYLFIKYMN